MPLDAKHENPALILRVARAIAERRLELGLSQGVLASRLNLALKNLQRIERGGQNLTLATLDRIATALETAPEALIHKLPPITSASGNVVAILRAAGYQARAGTSIGRRAATAVPITSLRAAAARASSSSRPIDTLGWLKLPSSATVDREAPFVARIEGTSMDPRVPRGAICLFAAAGSPPYRGRVMLVEYPSVDDHDGPFALKLVHVRAGRMTLRALNPEKRPITAAASDVAIIAELVSVLVPKADS